MILHIFNFTRLKLGYFTAQKLQEVKNVLFFNTDRKKKYNIKHLETFLCKYTSEVQKSKWGKVEDLEVLQRGKKHARLDPWINISLTYETFITGKNLLFFDFYICTDKYSRAIIYHMSPKIILTSFLNTKQRVQNCPFSFSFKIVLVQKISTRSSNQVCTAKPICYIFLQYNFIHHPM